MIAHRFFTWLFLAAYVFPATASAQVNIFGVDSWSDLVAAIEQLNAEDGGRIQLDRTTLTADQPLPEITTEIELFGNGAEIRGAPGIISNPLIFVGYSGTLLLRDLSLARLDVAEPIVNLGELRLYHVAISDIPVNQSVSVGQPRPAVSPLQIIHNFGNAELENVTITNTITFLQRVVENANGRMEIRNSSIARNRSYSVGRVNLLVQGLMPAAIASGGSAAVLTLGNTLLENEGGNCGPAFQGMFVDLGGNLDSDDSCGLDSSRNLVGRKARLASFGHHGGLVPTIALEPISPAINHGIDEFCPAVDARLASRLGRCDIGAFEFSGGFGNAGLDANGINGLWFNLASDGHYVHIMRVAADRAYINWTTFDRQGRQAWVFAVVSEDTDASYSGDAYINVGGTMIPGSAPVGQAPVRWGTLAVEFSDCVNGVFRYESNDPDFGSGEFGLERLAFIDGVGCTDPDKPGTPGH